MVKIQNQWNKNQVKTGYDMGAFARPILFGVSKLFGLVDSVNYKYIDI
jgi:hypothetical protein